MRGLKELATQLKELDAAVVGPKMQKILGEAADIWLSNFKLTAQVAGWPHRAIESAFTYSKPGGKRKQPSALFGITKRGKTPPYAPGYVEWQGEGRTVGMSLATMFEFGLHTGHNMAPRPAFRPALSESKEAMLDHIEEGMLAILAEAGKSRPTTQLPGIGGEFD